MESTLGKMKDTEVTNVLKMVHGWQNDGYQKDLFNGDGEPREYPAGCGENEGRLHFVKCKAVALSVGYKQRSDPFKKVHNGLKTAGVVYQYYFSILQHFREGGGPPSFVSHFESPMETLVKEAC